MVSTSLMVDTSSHPRAQLHRCVERSAYGQPEEAIRSFERSIRLSPVDPSMFSKLTGMGIAFICLGRFDEAVSVVKKALRSNPTLAMGYRCLAAALAHLGRDVEARCAATQLLAIEPNFRISEWMMGGGRWQPQIYIEGLRKAGLPD